MRERLAPALVMTGLLAGAGCKQAVDRAQFKPAINQSFTGRHECLWPEAVKLPAQTDPSKDEKTRDFDVLTDAGLLIRQYEEKKVPHAVPRQMNKYLLSDKGHSAWTPDPKQPDYGNFCFGHFNVTAVDKAIPNDPSNPTQYTVTYRYEVEGIPEWARTPAAMRAFRKVAADTAIQSATATVVKGANGGWEVVPAPPAP